MSDKYKRMPLAIKGRVVWKDFDNKHYCQSFCGTAICVEDTDVMTPQDEFEFHVITCEKCTPPEVIETNATTRAIGGKVVTPCSHTLLIEGASDKVKETLLRLHSRLCEKCR